MAAPLPLEKNYPIPNNHSPLKRHHTPTRQFSTLCYEGKRNQLKKEGFSA